MNTRVVIKIALFVLGVLVLIQLLFYNSVQTKKVQQSINARAELSQEIAELSITKDELEEHLAVLQNEYEEIVASVPSKILQGYDDHELILAGFLDYLKSSEFKTVDAKITMQGARKYINSPVPLFEHDMTFAFTFRNLSDAKKFLSFILDQDIYPLAVRSFELRSSGQKISGTLQASLLIPAKLQKPLFSTKEEER